MRLLFAGLCCLALAMPAQAETPNDPLAWLGRISSAAQRLNYTGTFIYQAGSLMETSRISHGVDAQGEFEHLVALDGSPREVIRSGDEVSCVLPNRKTVIIDQAASRRGFPGRLPASFAGVAENYRIHKGGSDRVAGHDTQVIVLDPRDDLRYGQMLWADARSGLLLKARLLDADGAIIEQFSFSEIRIGDKVVREQPAALPRGKGWRVVDARGSDVPAAQTGWVQRDPLPGFHLTSAMRRQLGGRNQGEALHLMFSDGLAAISVFIEPLDEHDKDAAPTSSSSGPVNIYQRNLDHYRLTALGEAPLKALQRLTDGLEPRP